jgi:hypothetical protein
MRWLDAIRGIVEIYLHMRNGLEDSWVCCEGDERQWIMLWRCSYKLRQV